LQRQQGDDPTEPPNNSLEATAPIGARCIAAFLHLLVGLFNEMVLQSRRCASAIPLGGCVRVAHASKFKLRRKQYE